MDKATETIATGVDKILPSQKTRWRSAITLTIIATAAWLLSFFGASFVAQPVTFEQWTSFIAWVYGLYATSEVGAKGSYAVLNK